MHHQADLNWFEFEELQEASIHLIGKAGVSHRFSLKPIDITMTSP